MLSLSTSWNALRHRDGSGMVSEIKELGFDSIEVNYQVSQEQLSQIQLLQNKGDIKVSSLHNLVPLPQGADPNTAHRLYPFTSPNPEVRKTAVELTKRTLDYAAKLGAKAVVLHLGESWDAPLVEMERSYVNAKLKSHQSREKIEDMRVKLIKLRRTYTEQGLERISECLKPLVLYAEQKKIQLGFENRYWHTQFPNLEELHSLLAEFQSDYVGLWYDIGHAATQEYLGFQRKNEILEKLSHRLIGVHLMDCIRNSDHLAPGQGSLDFAHLSGVLKPNTIKVLEMALYVPAEDIRQGVILLQKVGLS